MREYTILEGQGKYQVKLKVTDTQDGLIVHLLGGEKPHVGATVTSVPRPKKNGEGMTIDTWVIPVPGHKDAEVAKPVAEVIARKINQVVTVVAGVHIARAEKHEIKILIDNCLKAAESFLKGINDKN